jgi:hypothetical protein
MVFDKLFGKGRKKTPEPAISFGRYSDNNKTVAKVGKWTTADNLSKQQDYYNSIDAFFDYLRDDQAQNVVLERNGSQGKFQLWQGSKIVRGEFSGERLQAEITLARMPQPSVPVMRRLLDMNFNLYYCRYALDNDRLCMRFDSSIKTANPNKLYYGLRELATRADKMDDLLVQEFASLQTIDTEHVIEIPAGEKEVKYNFLQQSIKETLDYIASLDAEKFAGGIAYLLLTLAFRIDYLICPEGKLLNELEKIVEIYFKKDEKQTTERNKGMIEGYQKLMQRTKDEVFPFLFRSKHTFAIVTPQHHKSIADAIVSSHTNFPWYRDNQYPIIANRVVEYGFAFSQYSYSLPKPLGELFKLFMQVNYGYYFTQLGFSNTYFDPASNRFDADGIKETINEIITEWKPKYPKMEFRTNLLRFEDQLSFNISFTTEITQMNFDA